MAAITASMVSELRGKSDAPMMECKKALTEADGDMAKAEEILRVKLGNKATKAATRVAAEGVVGLTFPLTASSARSSRSIAKAGLRQRLRLLARVQLPDVDEAKREVPADAAMAALGKLLAERSAKLGRSYAVGMLPVDDRSRLLQAAAGTKGVAVRSEGEAHMRRVAFVPEKPTPMPKRNVAVYPDDEDEAD